jgi:O-antigen biosynthesis alpha-1,2-rhamnosyltransferase
MIRPALSTSDDQATSPAAGVRPARIFVDATYTLCSGKSSGIERVVRSIIREATHCKMGLKPQVVISQDGRFYPVSDRQVAQLAKPARMQNNVRSKLPLLYEVLAKGLCKVIPSRKLRKWILPEAGHLGMFKIPHTLYETFSRKMVVRTSKPIEPIKGDLFLLPDAYWPRRGVWAAVDDARDKGAMIATVVYDLIPITHPEFVGLKRKEAFLQYVHKVATKSDLIVAISETVRNQVAEFIPTICGDQPCCADLRSFELGAELSSSKGHVREEVQRLFSSELEKTPYLMVATFDPRKNHRYLISAFDLLWKQRPDLKLCLVGRIGWLCEELLIELEKHPRRNKDLFVFHDLSDAELQYCYSSSRGVIFPSIVEGFGLPIVEALWHGQKTFASDTPIHREVGRNDCSYFDLASPQSLVDSILEWESQRANSKPQLPTRQPIAWSESNQQLFHHCLDAYLSRNCTDSKIRRAA